MRDKARIAARARSSGDRSGDRVETAWRSHACSAILSAPSSRSRAASSCAHAATRRRPREHRAEIVADETIAGQVPAEVWGEAMADMLAEIREGRIAEGLAVGVRDVGAVLAERFPRDAEDTNELPDRLIEV